MAYGQVKKGLKRARGGRLVAASDAMTYGQRYLPPLGGGPGNWRVARPDDPRFADREMPDFNSSGVNPAFCPPRRSSLKDEKGRVYPQPKVTKRSVLPGLTGNPSERGCLKDAADILKRCTHMPIAQMCTAHMKPKVCVASKVLGHLNRPVQVGDGGRRPRGLQGAACTAKVHACVHVRVRVRACVRVCMCVCLPACLLGACKCA